MTPKRLGQAGAKGYVLLVQIGWRKRGAELGVSQVAENSAGVETTKDTEDGIGTSLRMCSAGQARFAAILAAKVEDERTARIAKCDGVAETKEKIAITKIGARGRKRRREGQRIGAVDVNVGVVGLLG